MLIICHATGKMKTSRNPQRLNFWSNNFSILFWLFNTRQVQWPHLIHGLCEPRNYDCLKRLAEAIILLCAKLLKCPKVFSIKRSSSLWERKSCVGIICGDFSSISLNTTLNEHLKRSSKNIISKTAEKKR